MERARSLVRTAGAILVASLLAEAGCGGTAVIDPDGASTSATTGSATAGGTSDGGSTSSHGGNGGTGGAGGAPTGGQAGFGGAPPDLCPPEKRSGPSPCAPDGLLCDYGGFCNSALCLNGQWTFPPC